MLNCALLLGPHDSSRVTHQVKQAYINIRATKKRIAASRPLGLINDDIPFAHSTNGLEQASYVSTVFRTDIRGYTIQVQSPEVAVVFYLALEVFEMLIVSGEPLRLEVIPDLLPETEVVIFRIVPLGMSSISGKLVQLAIAGDVWVVAQHNAGHSTTASAISHDIDYQRLAPSRRMFQAFGLLSPRVLC
jgi:hypothetical protein